LESGEGRTGLRWGKANPNQWDVRKGPLGGASWLETPCRQAASTRGSVTLHHITVRRDHSEVCLHEEDTQPWCTYKCVQVCLSCALGWYGFVECYRLRMCNKRAGQTRLVSLRDAPTFGVVCGGPAAFSRDPSSSSSSYSLRYRASSVVHRYTW
jgi:hypothetical protein